MSQRHPFSTVSCFRRFVSRDKISHYFDRFICQRLYYDADWWKLDVNINKTKVMVFSKKKNLNYSFILQDKQLEVVDKFSYLGIIFKYNGTFFDTKKKLVDQVQRSLHFIYKTIRNERIPVDLQLKLFDSMIEPILLYGSEDWVYEN